MSQGKEDRGQTVPKTARNSIRLPAIAKKYIRGTYPREGSPALGAPPIHNLPTLLRLLVYVSSQPYVHSKVRHGKFTKSRSPWRRRPRSGQRSTTGFEFGCQRLPLSAEDVYMYMLHLYIAALRRRSRDYNSRSGVGTMALYTEHHHHKCKLTIWLTASEN
ncbi:hypothetical protein AUEXF2481DRAFT_537397 [Aureobasidium subglaciale EXF-2481]|uniref:Uncharacterized protein n=1 Tax=Aureobasidium subglaciale (strain EXF-2481) TaxID=1043005 RepID=A0A074YUZ4_AURSE|nr:uncharacterized protein AUEXF2481DRAFT_537397 [Aureobasidium subglaciale EXF-2481]KEQ90641.1 hypothetical protein AUEXF2481DRAFT_537397 [Aureobasidium subglaciale EXF-2481]